MMIKKILFLVPIDRRNFERFGIKLLQKEGFDVESWDLSSIIYPVKYTPPDLIDWPNYKVFEDEDRLLNELKSLPPSTFVINFVDYSSKTIDIYRAISASKAKYAIFLANALPPAITKKRSFLQYLRTHPGLLPKKIINQLFSQLPFKWFGIKPASLILAGGEQSIRDKNFYPTDRTSEVLWAHTLDYDLYLKERKIPSSTKRSVAVFLDEYLPFHPDWSQLETPFSIDANKYYQLLNEFFTRVEQELGLKVVIAAHPRSRYEKLPDYFEGRECVKGKTINLIKESRLVLAHFSTALDFANLFRKPVIFLSSSDLDKSYVGPFIRTMANWFGKTPIPMDGNVKIDWDRELTVSADHYNRYYQAYIKTEHSEDFPFWQIVANRLKNWR
jgi:hypothetical protein